MLMCCMRPMYSGSMLHPGHQGREQTHHAQVAALRQRLAAAEPPAPRVGSAPGSNSERPANTKAAERAASPSRSPPAEAAEAPAADVDMGGEGDASVQGGGNRVGQVAPDARASAGAEGRRANAAEPPAAGPRGDALLLQQDAEVAVVRLPVSPLEVHQVLLVGVLAFDAAANIGPDGLAVPAFRPFAGVGINQRSDG